MAKTRKPAAKGKAKPGTNGKHVDLGDGKPQLPEMEDQLDQELVNLAKDYHSEMTRRMKASKKEKDSKNLVIEAMKKRDIKTYSYKGMIVVLSETENLKVKMPGDKDEE